MTEYPTTESTFEYDEQPESKWPTVIGVISLIYAIVGLLCQTGYAVSTLMTEYLMSLGGMDVLVPSTVKLVGVMSGVIGLLIGVIMVFGAINLLRRRRSGPKLLRVWVIARVLMVILSFASVFAMASTNIEFQREMEQATADMLRDQGMAGQIQEPKTDEELWRTMVLSTAGMSAAFLIYPVFVGIWFSRQRIREEITTWE